LNANGRSKASVKGEKAEGLFLLPFLFLGEIKGRMACFSANPVQCVLKGRSVDQGIHRFMSEGDIQERDPNENGEDTLAGEEKHDEAGKTQEVAQAVSDNLDQQGNSGMTFMALLHNRGMNEEIIGRGLGDQKGDEQQTDEKGRH
jgi:hypothetical protein